MNHSESLKELAAALAKAQGIMAAAKMDAVNPFLKNKYADLGSVIAAAKKPLADNGLSYSQHPHMTEREVGVTTILMHASGEWLESVISIPMSDDKGRSLAQNVGSIITYLRRYSLSAILGIHADEDTDGNDKERKQQPDRKPQPAPQAEAAPMTLDEAKDMLNSQGRRYGDIDTATLEGMEHGINAGMKKPGADVALYKSKLQAISLILADREKADEAAREVHD